MLPTHSLLTGINEYTFPFTPPYAFVVWRKKGEPIIFVGRLGGIVFNVLATGPKDRGFKPGRGNVFLRAIKSAAHLPSDWK
jgi:hypothetical protein